MERAKLFTSRMTSSESIGASRYCQDCSLASGGGRAGRRGFYPSRACPERSRRDRKGAGVLNPQITQIAQKERRTAEEAEDAGASKRKPFALSAPSPVRSRPSPLPEYAAVNVPGRAAVYSGSSLVTVFFNPSTSDCNWRIWACCSLTASMRTAVAYLRQGMTSQPV